MDPQTLMLFVVACLAINIIPGPDVVYIVSNTMKGKMTAGIKAAIGLGVGYLLHTLAAALGLSAIVLSSSVAFSVVKWVGAAYLLYLGVQALVSMSRAGEQPNLELKQESKNIFLQGIIVSALNPKVALFYLSFLPQFIDPSVSSVSYQLLALGVLFSCLATLCNLAYAIIGSWLFGRKKSKRYMRIMEGFSGILLISLAGKVVLSER